MIIQVRGTSGSGKSWVMRRVMDMMGDWQAEYLAGRKRPLYYRHVDAGWPPGRRFVLGHYDSPCGGCDTIGSATAVYELIQTLNPATTTMLCEGLLLSEDVKWSVQLPDLRVVFLDTDTPRCLDNIRNRRAAAGNMKELNEENTINRVPTIERARRKLLEAGVLCRRAPAEQAVDIVLGWVTLGWVKERA